MNKDEVENLGQPGKTCRVDAARHAAMRAAVMAVVPAGPPEQTPGEIIAAAKGGSGSGGEGRGSVAGPVPDRALSAASGG